MTHARLLAVLMAGSWVLTGCGDDDDNGHATCGDGVPEDMESCDGTDLRGQTCRERGYRSGTLGCNDDCTWDESGCVAEDCINGYDDDGDGQVDCDDLDCLGVDGCPGEACWDAVDNDGDQLTDCEDPDCVTNAPACNAGCMLQEDDRYDTCGNAADDDCDGLDDADDPDCESFHPLKVVRDLNGPPIDLGDVLEYTVVVFAGWVDWLDVVVVDHLPEEVVDASPVHSGVYDAGAHTVTWEVGDLLRGEGVQLRVHVTLTTDPERAWNICNYALISHAGSPGPYWSDDPATPEIHADPTCVYLPNQ